MMWPLLLLMSLLTAVSSLTGSRPPPPPPCTPSKYYVESAGTPSPERGCTILPDGCETSKPLCPPMEDRGSMCDECGCLFNLENCNINHTTHCSFAPLNLGLNCSRDEDPLEYILSSLNDTNETLCLSRRICHCLSRGATHNNLTEAEDRCRQLCVMRNTPTEMDPTTLSGDEAVCNSVHGQYCRRHMMEGRSVDCARECQLQSSCPTLIEDILEGDFKGSDLDAAVAVMREFRTSGAHRLHSRRILMAHSSFFSAIDNSPTTVIPYLNNNNSQSLVSLFDDLLSEERHDEWTELQEEAPGQEVLERIETTIHLLGMSHQLRPLLDHFEYIGSSIEMNVECQSGSGYRHVFNRAGADEAVLYVPENGYNGNNCTRVIAAALSSNVGEFVSNNTDPQEMVDTDIMTLQVIATVEGNGLSNVLLTFRSLNDSVNSSNVSATCVFWNASECQWSTEGVELVSANETHYICNSSHLSSFAVLVNVKPLEGVSEAETRALNAVTYIGCGISIICLLLTLFCMLAFRETLNKGVLLYIHFNLFLALLLALILFVSGLETAKNIKWLCTTVAALLHYLFLCVFCWMLAEGIVLYVLVVRAFATNFKKWYYFLPLGWGVPLVIVAITLGQGHDYYSNEDYCWLSHDGGLRWSFLVPMITIISVNTVILVLTVASIVYVQRKASRNKDKTHIGIVVTSVKSAVVLLPLLGITWIIGLFAVDQNTIVFAWAFTILNSLQGLMIFILHILRNGKLWSKIVGRCGFKTSSEKSYSSSTEYTSTGKRDSAPESMPNGHDSKGDVLNGWHSNSGASNGSVQRTFSEHHECQNFMVDFSESVPAE